MIMVRDDSSDGRRMSWTDGKDGPRTRTGLTKKTARHSRAAWANGPNGRTTNTKRVKLTQLNKTRCKTCLQNV